MVSKLKQLCYDFYEIVKEIQSARADAVIKGRYWS
jgi:hypothetical protein